MGNINTKIDVIAEHYFGGNNSAFAKAMSTSEANIRNYRNNTVPKLDFIINLKEKLGISFESLLGGQELNTLPQVNESPSSDDYIRQVNIPVYDLEQAGGLKKLLASHKKKLSLLGYISLPNAPKCDGAILASGDGMYPLVKSGDYLLYKKIEPILDQVFFGEMYLISLEMDGEEYTTFKYIQKSETKPDTVLLASFNPSFQTKEVSFSSITAIALIKATINKTSML